MKLNMVFLGAISLLLVTVSAIGQDINFKDLTRSGPVVVKRYTVTGLASDGAGYARNFSGIDTARVAQVREVQQYASSDVAGIQSNSSGNSEKSSKSGATKGSEKYSCKIWCRSSSGSLNSTSVTIVASNFKDAVEQAKKQANQVCKASGSARENSQEFDPSQCSGSSW